VLQLALYGLLAIVVAVGLFFLAAWLLPNGEQIAPPVRDELPWDLPSDSLRAEDVDSVRLPVALRGYRFNETDLLLDRLAGELRARDAEIERLRNHASAPLEDPDTTAPGNPWAANPWAEPPGE
jgi:DivIVA domain-containing protein